MRTTELAGRGAAVEALDPDGSVGRLVEAGRTLPSRWYTDDAIFALEQRIIFRRSWEYVGHRGQVAQSGDFFTCEVGGVPIVVVCGEDGRVRGLVNSCRESAHPVVTGTGRRPVLECGHHAWAYNLDGSFNNAPRAKEGSDFDGPALSLESVAVDFLGSMLFVNPSADAPPLADALGPIPGLARRRGLPLDEGSFRGRRSIEFDANWKIVWDNNCECYHCPTVHKSWYKTARLDGSHLYSYPIGPLHFEVTMEQYEGLKPDNSYYCWPAIFFMSSGGAGKLPESMDKVSQKVTQGHPGFIAFRFIPLTTQKTRLDVDVFSIEELTDQQVEDWFNVILAVVHEDSDVCARVQKSQDSGVGELGTLVSGIDSEYMTQVWERLIHRAMVRPTEDLYAPLMQPTRTWPAVSTGG